MRIKNFYILFAVIFVFILMPQTVYSSEGLIKPASRFYFLQSWGESARLLLAFSNEKKTDYLVELTDRRVNEIKDAPLEKVADRYQDHYRKLDELSAEAKDKEQVAEKIKKLNLRQQEVLADVYARVPESAKDAILNAQENSSKHVAKTVEAIEGKEKAQEYIAQVAQIKQEAQIKRMERLEQAPMEGAPAPNPSETAPKDLKGANPIMEGKELNPLNPLMEGRSEGGAQGQGQAEPVPPAPMAPPAPKN